MFGASGTRSFVVEDRQRGPYCRQSQASCDTCDVIPPVPPTAAVEIDGVAAAPAACCTQTNGFCPDRTALTDCRTVLCPDTDSRLHTSS